MSFGDYAEAAALSWDWKRCLCSTCGIIRFQKIFYCEFHLECSFLIDWGKNLRHWILVSSLDKLHLLEIHSQHFPQ
jgi:hypothetical protein